MFVFAGWSMSSVDIVKNEQPAPDAPASAAAPAAVDGEREPLMGLSERDEKFAKSLAAKLAVTSATFPLQCVKTLIQLGHEPFPLSTGKTLVVAGRNAYFLPNAISYAQQLANAKGGAILWTGLDAALVSFAVGGYTSHVMSKYLDDYYPEIGGKPENVDADELDLDDSQSFRRMLRAAIRDSVVRVCAVTAARPFTVVMVRQIAQLIGGERQYTNVFASLRIIGDREGPGGFFSGLAAQLVGELIVVWGVHTLTYAMERALTKSGLPAQEDADKAKKDVEDMRRFIHLAVPFVVNSFGYPYSVVSTVMACAGSGLAVSFLPYSPSFTSWHHAWDYLTPANGLKRGARMFLREQVGAVTVGVDKQLYAANKHFA